MATDPRIALTQLVAALEKHFEAVAARRGDGDSSVERAYDNLEDALTMTKRFQKSMASFFHLRFQKKIIELF
jgi:hypothetical protein